MDREIVTVCKLEGQWGLWLPGCQEHVTQYYGQQIGSKAHALAVVGTIKAAYYTEYRSPLLWQVEVVDEAAS